MRTRAERLQQSYQELQALAPAPGGGIDWQKALMYGGVMAGLGAFGKGIPLGQRLLRMGVYGAVGTGSSVLGQEVANRLPERFGGAMRTIVSESIASALPPLMVSPLGRTAAVRAARAELNKAVGRQSMLADAIDAAITEGDWDEAVKLFKKDQPNKLVNKLLESRTARGAVNVLWPTKDALPGTPGILLNRWGNEYVMYDRMLKNSVIGMWEQAGVRQALSKLTAEERRAAAKLTEFIAQDTKQLNVSAVPEELEQYLGTRVEEAARRIVDAYSNIGVYLVKMGLMDANKLRRYYHPHTMTTEIMKIMYEGREKDLEKAVAKLIEDNGIRYRRTTPAQTIERRTEQLLNEKLHNLDPEVAFRVYVAALESGAQGLAYGKGFRKLAGLAQALRAAGRKAEAELVENLLSRFKRVGSILPETARKLASDARAIATIAYMPLAALSNATQVTQNLVVTRFNALMKELPKVDMDIIRQVAPSGLQSLRDIATEMAVSGKSLPHKVAHGVLTVSGFIPFEVINRTGSVLTGYVSLIDIAKRAAAGLAKPWELRQLSKYGIDVNKLMEHGAKAVTPEDLRKAAIGVERWTQFGGKIHEMPTVWGEPAVKLVTQFKQYALAQARLVTELGASALKEFFHTGDLSALAPLAKLGLLTPTLGYMVKDIRERIIAQPREEKPGSALDKFIQLSSYALGAGLALESLRVLSQTWDDSNPIPVWRLGSDLLRILRRARKNVQLWGDTPLEALRYSGLQRLPLFAVFGKFLDPQNAVLRARQQEERQIPPAY